MRKLSILWILVLIMVSSVSALDICKDEITTSETCFVVTPAGMTCTTYNAYDPDNATDVSGGTIGVVNAAAGVYGFPFSSSAEGGWTFQLCDNSTAFINVKSDTTRTRVDKLNTTVLDLSADVGVNFTDLITHGDATWSATSAVNTTLIAEDLLTIAFLANKTIVYNYNSSNKWYLNNTITTWDDWGYTARETFVYAWDLDNTTFKREN